jgi:molybdenum storage protein
VTENTQLLSGSRADRRPHVRSLLMRESLLDKDVMSSTETPIVRMLPDCHVLKVGGRSILDGGRETTYPLVDAIGEALENYRLIIGTGGVAAIPPAIFGHLLPLFIQAVPGVIFNGDPPFSLWEHPPGIGRIPPHRSDAGTYLLAECFGCATMTLIKDVDGLYDRDPKEHPNARFIDQITVAELSEMNLPTLPFDRSLIGLLERSRLVTSIQIINGLEPDRLLPALRGEHVGTIIRRD